MKQLLLASLLLALTVHSASAALLAVANCPRFQCSDANPQVVIINNRSVLCDGNKLCNKYGLNECQMCVSCQPDVYMCLDRKTVRYNNEVVSCLDNYICNDNASPQQCDPCIREKCPNAPNYICINETMVSLNNLAPVSCRDGSICNVDNIQPCGPCIVPDETNAPAVPNKPWNVANCNDGHGRDTPCRRGPSGNYYWCKPVWNWFEYEVRLCSQKNSDINCRSAPVC